MKKRSSILYAVLHILLFLCSMTCIFSLTLKIKYLNSYNPDETDFCETEKFNESYIKYIERLTLFVHYSDAGYTVVQSSPDRTEDILQNNEYFSTPKDALPDQENFDFYNDCLNIKSTNFLYYVKNVRTGEVYYSPFLDTIYPGNIEQFTADIKKNKAFFLMNTKTGKYTTNLPDIGKMFIQSDLDWISNTLNTPMNSTILNKKETEQYIIYTGIFPDFSNNQDVFYTYHKKFQTAREGYDFSSYCLPISLIVSIILLMILIYQTGHQKPARTDQTYGIYLYKFDLLYSDVTLLLYIGIGIVELLLLHLLFFDWDIRYDSIRTTLILAGINDLLLVSALFSLIRRIKSRTLLKNSLLYLFFKKLGLRLKDFFTHQNITFRVAGFLAVFILIQCFAFVCYWFTRNKILLFLLFFISYLYLIAILMRNIIDYAKVVDYLKKVKDGNMNQKLSIESFTSTIHELGSYINNIQGGLSAAVEEQTKSEHFKVELITNVSHDIKTPLTSIINYVDLLKKEPADSPKIKEYLEILTNKSWRLKTLIEDLVEASKASSGAIKMNPQRINLAELIKQATGEFEDRLQENNLEIVLSAPENPIYVYADGRSTYRVIDNLLSNVNKYAMKGTRVYIDLLPNQKFAMLSIKNISNAKLNITPDELMERFVRGDASRNTEGSGLGLSIARSLTTLQRGTFDIDVDGDLFKVTLSLPLFMEQSIT